MTATPVPMDTSELTAPTAETLRKAMKQAAKGDERALSTVKHAFDVAPRLWRGIGDLAGIVETAAIRAMCGDDLVFRESVERSARAMREELAGPSPSALERLLVDRIVACWLHLHYAEANYAQNMGGLSRAWAEFHQRRIDRAQRRYLAAIRTLAQVRRLLIPAVQVNIAERQVNVLQGGTPGE